MLGSRVDLLDEQEVYVRLRRALADPWDGHCRHVATLNPEYVIAARRDPGFATSLARGDVVTADGIGVAVAARLRGGGLWNPLPARVTGVAVAEWLAAESRANSPLFLLGGGPGVAEAAAGQLRRRFPGAVVAGTWDGGTPRPEEDREALSRIAASGARSLLVAYGAPGQVLWIDRNRAALASAGVRVAAGVGGAMDYLADRVPRAPERIRRLGLEWLYRLVRQPWRWRRQLVLPQFALLAILEWLWRRGNRAGRYVRRVDLGDQAAGPSDPVDRGRLSGPDGVQSPQDPKKQRRSGPERQGSAETPRDAVR